MENSFIATHGSLNAQKNIALVTYIEHETVRLAKEQNFHGIYTHNTNGLTQQLAHSVLNYETILDFQINEFVDNGRKPFTIVPDSIHWMIQWKKI